MILIKEVTSLQSRLDHLQTLVTEKLLIRHAQLLPVHMQGDSIGNGYRQGGFERINGFSG